MRRRVAPAVVSRGVGIFSLFVVLAGAVAAQTPTQDNSSQTGATGLTTPAPLGVCRRNLRANVVALDQPLMMNRLGAAMPQGMIFALERDVVVTDPNRNTCGQPLCPGNVRLRDDKRPRPITLRMSVGDCLQIRFRNLLSSDGTTTLGGMKPKTRTAGVHVAGLELRDSINSDGSWVGRNPGTTGSMVPPNGVPVNYTYYAPAEGVFMLYSLDDGRQGQLGDGMWGSVNVQPSDAEYYRSQVTYDDLLQATYRPDQLPDNQTVRMTLTRKTDANGNPITVVVDGAQLPLWVLTTLEKASQTVRTSDVVTISNRLYAYEPELNGKRGHPIINYQAVYQAGPRAGTPILSMLRSDGAGFELMHSDLTAIITGPNADRFPYSNVSPSFRENSATPDRRQPYREFTISYHNNFNVVQAFQQFGSLELSNMLANGQDNFGINYGMGGIGAEILANRLGVGPMGNADAVDLKFEEFFLSSWSVGDPAMVVDVPANAPNQVIGAADKGSPVDQTKLKNQLQSPPIMSPLSKQKATKAFYADDPSNVYHSYMRDHLKFRIMNTGGGPPHVHHQHAHQWLHTPNSDDGHYLDSQMINAGSTYTLEMTYNGSGNRNQTVGDSIFHCHFYPHFASGMWSLWRVHDVFEAGTEMMPDPNDPSGAPVPRPGSRALPDGEITRGTPIPAIVPLPTLAMAPIPARVKLSADGRTAEVIPDTGPNGQPVLANPGYPFFVPGVAGHRAPHPP
ncbi:MAG TPA: hypothetical protein VG778_08120, partial [Blastocatellia bacterium]|nr:hypothetical protein [Blastocatellia bacterium]